MDRVEPLFCAASVSRRVAFVRLATILDPTKKGVTRKTKLRKQVTTMILALCLLLTGLPFASHAAVVPEEGLVEPLELTPYTSCFIAISTNGYMLGVNTSGTTPTTVTLPYSSSNVSKLYWKVIEVGTVNGHEMIILSPSSKSDYALTVNPSTSRVTLQPYSGTQNNLQYWYVDEDPMDGDHLYSGAALTTAYEKRMNISTTGTITVGGNGTLIATFAGQYIPPTSLMNYKETLVEITTAEDYVIDTNCFYGSGYSNVLNSAADSYKWFYYSSSNTSIATVTESGVIYPVTDGNVTITCTEKISGAIGTVNVHISNA